ncbi:MAG TPA: hypothetical protein VFZ61_34185 [Polyangiales bacterium]
MHLRSLLPLLLGLTCLAWPAWLPRARGAARPLPVLFHVALESGKAVAEPAFLAQQLERANAIFAPLGVTLACVGLRSAVRVPAAIVSREQRDALGMLLQPRVLNVFVTGTLMDVDEPGRARRGVHWRVRSEPRRHLVILSAKAGPHVLAHELGHFFGNPAHSQTPGNLMSYTPTEALPWLDPAQIARVQASAARMLAEGELKSRGPGKCFDP